MYSKVVVVNSTAMGRGNDDLGKTLMGAFLRKLWASDSKPDAMIFYNEGVKLLAKGSEVLDALNALADSGVDLLACGTCVKYFGLDDQVMVGRVSNMEEITGLFMSAASVVTI